MGTGVKKPELGHSKQELMKYFELFDWWLPARIADECDMDPDKARRFSRLRKLWTKASQSDDPKEQESEQSRYFLEFAQSLKEQDIRSFQSLLPQKICGDQFRFIDLFAGIGGLRLPFSRIGGQCVLTCEWDEYAKKTYQANWQSTPGHQFVSDIKSLTQPGCKGSSQVKFIDKQVPDHELLLAGFPCQPFSIAGVSKKNALNRAHGFDCEDQGQLFFDIARILFVKQPAVAVLENVKNLKSHNKGSTFAVIKDVLTKLPTHQSLLFGSKNVSSKNKQAYWIVDLDAEGKDPKVIDARDFVPQHRERLVLLCIRKDLSELSGLNESLSLKNIVRPVAKQNLTNILEPNSKVPASYTLSPALWDYLERYAKKHKEKGNGFGYGLVRRNQSDIARTLSARYYKDGSEILICQKNMSGNPLRQGRPRKLTPQECARLMGFVKKGELFKIPVSNTRGYKQFGNSVVVPVFESVAKLISPWMQMLKDHM